MFGARGAAPPAAWSLYTVRVCRVCTKQMRSGVKVAAVSFAGRNAAEVRLRRRQEDDASLRLGRAPLEGSAISWTPQSSPPQ